MDKAEIQIIIAAHKECLMPADEMYLPVQVGAAESGRIGYVPDNIGDNISAQNHLYSELTGLYWAWKNLRADYIGLVQYRRYFKEPHPGMGRQQIYKDSCAGWKNPQNLEFTIQSISQPFLQKEINPELPQTIQSGLPYDLRKKSQNTSLRSRGALEISSEALQWQEVTDQVPDVNRLLGQVPHIEHDMLEESGENSEILGGMDAVYQKQLDKVLTCDSLEPMLAKTDIILPRRRNYRIETLYSHYAHTHSAEHLDVTRAIIAEQCPQYLMAFDAVMRRTSAHMFNMMIMRWSRLNEYCSWLFPILEELVERIDASEYDAYQARFAGRVSELMMDVWLERCGYAYQELPVVMIGPARWGKKVKAFLGAKFLGKKYRESF